MLPLYSVKFFGYYPVGAVALVAAQNKERAREIFLAHLSLHHPTLVATNSKELTNIDFYRLPAMTATEVEFVEILLDGDY